MNAQYYRPQQDITTYELALINGFLLTGILDTIEQRAKELSSGSKLKRGSIQLAGENFNKTQTIIVSGHVIERMPYNIRRHFSAY